MRIPTGNFGNSVAQPQQATRVSPDAFGAPQGQVLANLGQEVVNASIDRLAEKTRKEAEARDAQLSSDAADAALAFEANVKSKSPQWIEAVQSGQMDADTARKTMADEVSRIREETIGKLPHSKFSSGASRHASQVQMQVGLQLDGAVQRGVQQRFAAQANSALDSLGKLIGQPSEPLESVLGKADTVYPDLAARAGLSPVQSTKTLQEWKDNARYQRARMDLTAVRRDPAALDAYVQRLDAGDLTGVLDPDKRAVLAKEAESYKWQMQQAAQHDEDKREKIAERAITGATRQIESAVPLSVDAWDDLRSKVASTSHAGNFNALVKQERETQSVLRMPMGQQEAYVQQRQAKLAQEGGTLADKANLQRIQAVIENNRKELQQAPLVASQRLFGRQAEPIDLADLMQPGGTSRAAALFADRATTLTAMQKQFGPVVGQKPLLPQEQELLGRAVDQASPSQAMQLFGALRAAIDDDDTYRAAMQQLAPDSPVKARAGTLAVAGKTITIDPKLIADDVRVSSARVAQTMLAGEAIVAKTKGQKTQDGQARSLFAPSRESFAAAFAEKVGDLYRGRAGAQEGDLQAAYAWYVGRAAELGQTTASPTDIDPKLAKQAVAATLGDVIDFNGHGQVKAPLGMTGDDMRTRVRQQFVDLVKEQGLPASLVSMYEHYGLVNYRRDGQYVLTLGGVPVVDPRRGIPLIIDLDPPPITGTRYRSATDLIPVKPPAKSAGKGAP